MTSIIPLVHAMSAFTNVDIIDHNLVVFYRDADGLTVCCFCRSELDDLLGRDLSGNHMAARDRAQFFLVLGLEKLSHGPRGQLRECLIGRREDGERTFALPWVHEVRRLSKGIPRSWPARSERAATSVAMTKVATASMVSNCFPELMFTEHSAVEISAAAANKSCR